MQLTFKMQPRPESELTITPEMINTPTEIMTYAHILLFLCLQCMEPVIVTVLGKEETDGKFIWEAFDVRFKCGWLKRLSGIVAFRHHVAPTWEMAHE